MPYSLIPSLPLWSSFSWPFLSITLTRRVSNTFYPSPQSTILTYTDYFTPSPKASLYLTTPLKSIYDMPPNTFSISIGVAWSIVYGEWRCIGRQVAFSLSLSLITLCHWLLWIFWVQLDVFAPFKSVYPRTFPLFYCSYFLHSTFQGLETNY